MADDNSLEFYVFLSLTFLQINAVQRAVDVCRHFCDEVFTFTKFHEWALKKLSSAYTVMFQSDFNKGKHMEESMNSVLRPGAEMNKDYTFDVEKGSWN